jgi:hypothetical protein
VPARHDGCMADRDKGTDIDKLLAEVDGMMSGGGTPAGRAVAPKGEAQSWSDGIVAQVRAATVSGAVAGVGVWFLFAILPFLRAPSGAIGAFLAAFGAVLVFRRRR